MQESRMMIHGDIAARQIYHVAASCLVKTAHPLVRRLRCRSFFKRGTVALYFNEVLIAENLVFSLAPMPFTTAMMASEMPAAINPYSIAVAAVSSAQNFRINVIMAGRVRPDL
jgi:hypothetical protein